VLLIVCVEEAGEGTFELVIWTTGCLPGLFPPFTSLDEGPVRSSLEDAPRIT
jgi:hypothetical protein